MANKNSTHVSTGQRSHRRKPSTGAPVKAAPTKIADTSATPDKSSKSRKKSAKPARYIGLNKREFVLKFVKNDASIIWPREMKIVNSLFEIFPDHCFWTSLSLSFKLNSLCWLLSDDGRKFLNTEYKKFLFEPNKPEIFELKNNNLEFEPKIGSTVEAPMTVREFLNLWQKKN
jgi:hypothetical protein